MKVTHASTINTQTGHTTKLRNILYVIGAIFSWAFLMLATLLTGFLSGWVMLAVVYYKSLPQDKVLYAWLVLLVLTCGLAWLVARFFASWRRVGWIVGSTLAILLVTWTSWSVMYPSRALFLARELAWGKSSVRDYQKFPERLIKQFCTCVPLQAKSFAWAVPNHRVSFRW